MGLRYLFGPVDATFAEEYLGGPRQAGDCLVFDSAPGTDLVIRPDDTWEDICACLPFGWRPDFVALTLAYTAVPAAFWRIPVPLVGLASNSNLLWHSYRRVLRRCDMVLTDTVSAEHIRQAGLRQVHVANLFGLGRSFLELAQRDTTKDLDIVFVGNLQPAVQRERLAWLGRLARLADRWHIAIRTSVSGEEYRALLARARVVFNRSIRGECNRRALEATAAGALLFQEAGNREVPAFFREGEEYIAYPDADLEQRLDYYLTHEEQRRHIAAAGRCRALGYGYEALWTAALGHVEAEWPWLQERALARSGPSITPGRSTQPGAEPLTPPEDEMVEDLLTRTWQALSISRMDDPLLVAQLESAVLAHPFSASLRNALGLTRTLAGAVAGPMTMEQVVTAAVHFSQATTCDPTHVVAALNLVEVLAGIGHTEQAVAEAQRALALLDEGVPLAPDVLDAGRFPPGFDLFRVEWERAAWENAGRPEAERQAKFQLLRWRLHTLLGELTGDLIHFQEAAHLRPELGPTQAALGCALGRAGRADLAIVPLTQAVHANPFDMDAARALAQALLQTGAVTERCRLVEEYRRLAQAAPQVVSIEPWFAEEPVAGQIPSQAGTQEYGQGAFRPMSQPEFERRFGHLDTTRALCAFTPPHDTHVVLTLLAHARPRRILEIGTAAGHMTANLTEWSPDDAVVFTLGTVTEFHPADGPQGTETPPRAAFGIQANHFGRADKVLFINADSLRYDFQRLGSIEFAFVDGAHDLEHVLSDTRNAYKILAPGGWLVWHDVGSSTPWVEVDEALVRAGLPESIHHVEGTGVAFLRKRQPEEVLNPQRQPLAVLWEGPQASLHSLALVNRMVCRGLIERGHDVSLWPHGELGGEASEVSLPEPLVSHLFKPLGRPADVQVRHQWPPDFTPPPSGHWVMIQPWEYGSLPREWVGPILEGVDEVWAYTRHVRDCYTRSGVPADRVHVVPLGVDTSQFHPQVPPLALKTRKRFSFLFVGGTIARKGIDLVLAAYTQTFSAADDVCLVIKDMGVGTFYQGQTSEELIRQTQSQPGAPEVEYLDQALSAEELAGLYTACDCLVHPYRGEGFGLPIAEAMACGLTVVVTGHGAALDFCSDATAYLIPAKVVHFPEKRVGDLETVDYPWLAEPDLQALKNLLRRVVAHPGEARVKGHAAWKHIRDHFTWDHATRVVEQRLEALRQRPIRRFTPAVPSRTPTVAPATPREGRQRVSLSMIVKNEERNLPTCLGSVADLVDDIVVVDTGSTDRTREIAASFGARVFDFGWVDSFAEARNASLHQVTGDWVLWLDGDDLVDDQNRQRLRTLLSSLKDEKAAYVMKCLCLPEHDTGAVTVVDHVRLFRYHPDLRWEYRVHEQILGALRRQGAEIRLADIVIHHTGYQDPAHRPRKVERDLRLLQLQDRETPDDPFVLFNLGSLYSELNRPAEALPLFRRSLKRSSPQDSIVRKLYALITICHRQLGQTQEALAVCREGLACCPNDVELLYTEARLLQETGDLSGAIARLNHVLRMPPADYFASVDPGLRGYKARLLLGQLYRGQGLLGEAEAAWRTAVEENPEFGPAWLELGQLYLAQGRWDEFERILGNLQTQPRHAEEAALLQARGHLARKEFSAARRLLEEVIARTPKAIYPRQLLTHVLLQEGKDWAVAERALRDILALDPRHGEARNNLAILLRQLGRAHEVSW